MFGLSIALQNLLREMLIEVYNAMPYRVGDNVKRQDGSVEGTIESIEENRFLFLIK